MPLWLLVVTVTYLLLTMVPEDGLPLPPPVSGFLFDLLPQVMKLVLVVHLIYMTLSEQTSDLVVARMRLRKPLAGGAGLLVPPVSGVLVLVPPMVYFEKLHVGSLDVSFWQFYPRVFPEGVCPVGHLSWHHLLVTVALGFYVVPTEWSVLTKYLVVTLGTVLVVLLIYRLLIRPFKPGRILFGMKP